MPTPGRGFRLALMNRMPINVPPLACEAHQGYRKARPRKAASNAAGATYAIVVGGPSG
jgi:hypothetical protein